MPQPSHVTIKLTPKAASNRIGDTTTLPDGTPVLKVYVTAPPENNKANQAMLALLAKHWGVPQSQLVIVQGATSRLKVVQRLC